MRSASILSVFAAVSTVSARLIGIAAPSSIAAGSNFTITIITENYIQSVLDVSAAFGLTQIVYPDSLGSYLTSVYLGPSESNILTNVSVPASIPVSQPAGSGYHLIAAITSLYGAAHSPTTTLFDLPVAIGNATRSELTSTFDGTDCSVTTTSTATATTSSGSGPGSFSDLNTLIQGLETGLNSLILDIVRSDTATAENDYNTLLRFFNQLLHLAAPSGSCNGSTTGGELTENEAIQLIQTIQSTLNLVSLDITNRDSAAALTDACAAQADYFNSGLHEYVFGPDQASGTGQ